MVTIHDNDLPLVFADANVATVQEGDISSLTGDLKYPIEKNAIVHVDWGDYTSDDIPVAKLHTHFSATHQYPDEPDLNEFDVTLTVNVDPSSGNALDINDPRNDSTWTTATIAPRPFSVFLSGPTTADQGDTVHMSAVLTDDDATDDFYSSGGYTFNWSISGQDGFSESGQQLVEPTKVTDGASFTFPYPSTQAYTVDLTVTDDDGLTESASWVINGQQGLPHVGIEDAGTVPVGGTLDFTVYLVGCCDTDVTVGYTISGGASGSGRVTIPASHTSTDLLVPAGAVDTLTTVTAAIWDPDPTRTAGAARW